MPDEERAPLVRRSPPFALLTIPDNLYFIGWLLVRYARTRRLSRDW
jgi:hypothetical protein